MVEEFHTTNGYWVKCYTFSVLVCPTPIPDTFTYLKMDDSNIPYYEMLRERKGNTVKLPKGSGLKTGDMLRVKVYVDDEDIYDNRYRTCGRASAGQGDEAIIQKPIIGLATKDDETKRYESQHIKFENNAYFEFLPTTRLSQTTRLNLLAAAMDIGVGNHVLNAYTKYEEVANFCNKSLKNLVQNEMKQEDEARATVLRIKLDKMYKNYMAEVRKQVQTREHTGRFLGYNEELAPIREMSKKVVRLFDLPLEKKYCSWEEKPPLYIPTRSASLARDPQWIIPMLKEDKKRYKKMPVAARQDLGSFLYKARKGWVGYAKQNPSIMGNSPNRFR